MATERTIEDVKAELEKMEGLKGLKQFQTWRLIEEGRRRDKGSQTDKLRRYEIQSWSEEAMCRCEAGSYEE